jgi:hypothetical protein
MKKVPCEECSNAIWLSELKRVRIGFLWGRMMTTALKKGTRP